MGRKVGHWGDYDYSRKYAKPRFPNNLLSHAIKAVVLKQACQKTLRRSKKAVKQDSTGTLVPARNACKMALPVQDTLLATFLRA